MLQSSEANTVEGVILEELNRPTPDVKWFAPPTIRPYLRPLDHRHLLLNVLRLFRIETDSNLTGATFLPHRESEAEIGQPSSTPFRRRANENLPIPPRAANTTTVWCCTQV